MKVLTFAGSLRQKSLNKKLCHFVENFVGTEKLAEVEFVDLQSLSIPIYDGDVEASSGIPQGILSLIEKIQGCDALIISSPEYNGSISSALKTTLDWVSRHPSNALSGKHVLLLAASPGALGGVRGLWHGRVPLEVLGCHVYPEMFGLSKAHENLTDTNDIQDAKMKERLQSLVKKYLEFCKKS
ncbi:NADPH-dependent FMN reductase [Pseudobdellovibrio exovorus]|uniref:NADPH-dependent FMN reductase-like domain-containing protein n=1 Tax=Pseudobdellovibrio exovorus JSS TaxID=1184267 RepID=M4VC86_9BACT|nr:NAD(P)H-dependent oxidoreductase [Pseudobdellovibrio exovorus]AGH96090.1 hypothetical protein A11Q_1874 [Pseudobdellovibrio exovorus JSS]